MVFYRIWTYPKKTYPNHYKTNTFTMIILYNIQDKRLTPKVVVSHKRKQGMKVIFSFVSVSRERKELKS